MYPTGWLVALAHVCDLMLEQVNMFWVTVMVFHSTADGEELEQEMEDSDPNAGRFVRYQFTPQFLKLKTVGAT